MRHDFKEAVLNMLAICEYPEDVAVMQHFVFHPRMNGCSNLCVLCDHAVETTENVAELWVDGHAKSCPFLQTAQRMRGRETLNSYTSRK